MQFEKNVAKTIIEILAKFFFFNYSINGPFRVRYNFSQIACYDELTNILD